MDSLYVRYPPLTGMNKGDTNDAPVLNTDIGATVMEIMTVGIIALGDCLGPNVLKGLAIVTGRLNDR